MSRFRPEADPDAPKTEVRQLTGENRTILSEGDALEVAFPRRGDKWKYSRQLFYSYQLDQQEWSAFREAMVFSFPHPAAGRHYFQVRAMDGNGNVDPGAGGAEFHGDDPVVPRCAVVAHLPARHAGGGIFCGGGMEPAPSTRAQPCGGGAKSGGTDARTGDRHARTGAQPEDDRAGQRLAAGIAHDFNNILSIIKGSAQIIEDNPGDPGKIRTRVDRIKTVVQQGAEIVEAMLGFSRGSESATRCDVECGGGRHAGSCSATGSCAKRKSNWNAAANCRNCTPLRGNSSSKSCLNMIFNAAEAMTGTQANHAEDAPGGKTAAGHRAPAGDGRRICADLGAGLGQRDGAGGSRRASLNRSFTTKALTRRRGTGLGLSMVYELAKKMGAGLAVQSAVGEGSVFTLILPVRTERREETPKAQLQS